MNLRRMAPWLTATLLACDSTPAPRSSAPSSDLGSEPKPPVEAPTQTTEKATPASTATPAPDLSAAPTTTEIEADTKRANAFTFKMLTRTKKPSENVMLSGTSLRLALATTYVGAHGTTASEMASAVSLDADQKVAARLAHAELAAWKAAAGSAELSIASRLWADDQVKLKPDFTKLAETAFGAAPAVVDYAKPEDARKTINTWTAENTKNKISELLPPGAVEPTTRLVVTNALWFKGSWQFPFPKNATQNEPFKVDGKKSVSVPSMHLTDSFRIATLPDAKVLEMRYSESRLAMLVVLPEPSSSLAKLEAGLDEHAVERWNAGLTNGRVKVTLPRFSFRFGGSMGAPLRELGVKEAFTEKADFTGIAEMQASDRLFIGDVFHQTWIAVDELGTEAAAATGVTMRTTSLVTGPVVEFKVDRPFLFVIEDTKDQRVLFAGHVVSPQ